MLKRLRTAVNGLSDPLPLWNKLPLSRRAGVLALLYDDGDDLGVVLTVRAAKISYGGDVALPGGNADDINESPWQVALRECHEEIHIPSDTLSGLEHVGDLPAYLSSRGHGVIPSIAFYNGITKDIHTGLPSGLDISQTSPEVQNVFGIRLGNLLQPKEGSYHSEIVNWNGIRFSQHFFDAKAPLKRVGDPSYFKLWGLTASILVDIARLTHGAEPSFKHRKTGIIGDQPLVEALAQPDLPLSSARIDRKERFYFRRLLGKESPLLDIRQA